MIYDYSGVFVPLLVSFPAARSADPREEHLIPLMVCAGASENGMCQRVFSENLPGWNN